MWKEVQCYNGTQSRVTKVWCYKREVQLIGNMSVKKSHQIWGKWPLSSWLCFLPVVKIFRDALVFDITFITIDWISRHLYFVLKESQNRMQIFDMDLENKVKYPRKLKACNRNSTITSFSVYPFLRYVKCICFYCDEIDINIFNVISLI